MAEKKNKGGRPTKLTPELLVKAREYVESAWDDGNDVVPTIEAMALYVGTSTVCLYQWEKEGRDKRFSNIMKDCRAKQSRLLLNSGLKGEFNTVIAKLMLNKHGYHDKQEIDSSVTINSDDVVLDIITRKNGK